MNANNGDRGLRINPATVHQHHAPAFGLPTPEYFMAKKDQRSIVEPGYTLGGPLWKNKLWLFSSYIPSIDTTRRTTNFTGRQSRARAP